MQWIKQLLLSAFAAVCLSCIPDNTVKRMDLAYRNELSTSDRERASPGCRQANFEDCIKPRLPGRTPSVP